MSRVTIELIFCLWQRLDSFRIFIHVSKRVIRSVVKIYSLLSLKVNKAYYRLLGFKSPVLTVIMF